MRKGTCKYFTGTAPECGKGINRRELVGGPDRGWWLRLPCTERHHTDVVREHYTEPTDHDIQDYHQDIQAYFQHVATAMEMIRKLHPGSKASNNGSQNTGDDSAVRGTVTCPKCGQELRYYIASNHHVYGQCSTDGCLSWMQ